jgi:hypothetical protein
MHKIMKIFFLAVILLIAAFFANYFGCVSIPWLDVNPVPTYGGAMHKTDAEAQKALND